METLCSDVMLIPDPYYLLSRDNVLLESHILLVKSPVILRSSGVLDTAVSLPAQNCFQLLHFQTVGEHRVFQTLSPKTK